MPTFLGASLKRFRLNSLMLGSLRMVIYWWMTALGAQATAAQCSSMPAKAFTKSITTIWWQIRTFPLPSKDKLGYGGVVGIAKLVLCARPDEIPPTLTREQRAHFSGVPRDGFGFLFEHAKPLTLMPCPGKLGIFEIDMNALLDAPPPAQAALF